MGREVCLIDEPLLYKLAFYDKIFTLIVNEFKQKIRMYKEENV